jgi:hypothetical protein
VRRIGIASDALPKGVHLVAIEHGNRCPGGRRCDCVPDISILNPDHVTIIDAQGRPWPATRQ